MARLRHHWAAAFGQANLAICRRCGTKKTRPRSGKGAWQYNYGEVKSDKRFDVSKTYCPEREIDKKC